MATDFMANNLQTFSYEGTGLNEAQIQQLAEVVLSANGQPFDTLELFSHGAEDGSGPEVFADNDPQSVGELLSPLVRKGGTVRLFSCYAGMGDWAKRFSAGVPHAEVWAGTNAIKFHLAETYPGAAYTEDGFYVVGEWQRFVAGEPVAGEDPGTVMEVHFEK